MKYILLFVGILVLVFVGVGLKDKEVIPEIPLPVLKTYTSEKFGISFKYPDSYFLTEKVLPGSELREHTNIMLVKDTEFNRKLIAGEIQGTEGPTAITFDVYQNNLDKQELEVWLIGSNDSNFKLSDGSYGPIEFAGVEAVEYSWDGLYRGETVAFIHKENIIAASVTYFELQDQIRKDFFEMLKTVELK